MHNVYIFPLSSPNWQGYKTTEIYLSTNDGRWILKDRSLNRLLASYNGSSIWPVGQRLWNMELGVCGQNVHQRLLKLSR